MRALLVSLLVGFVLVACTPEARVVDPPGGSGGSSAGEPNGSAGEPSGSAGEPNGSAGQSGGDCLTPTSPRPNCTACMAAACATEIAACGGTACACGDFGDKQGQINCLLACPEIEPNPDAVAGCAQSCGFGDLMQAARPTVDLWECLVVPPSGPPACPECFNMN